MAQLSKPTEYNFEDSNIALLGSDLEKRVRENAGDKEPAWEHAGTKPGLQIWRIEKFHVVDWPQERYGTFYDGDSYIVLHTYKRDPDSETLSYDLHFWLGANTTQDEAGTAAYKTVELDDHLNGLAVQRREIQGFESFHFLSYFPRFTTLRGGVSTGFHHVTTAPAQDVHRLYRIAILPPSAHRKKANLIIREVPAEAKSLVEGDVFVLDKGREVWQLNTKASVGKEKFTAAEFVHSLVDAREGECKSVVFDEGGPGAGNFLAALGAEELVTDQSAAKSSRPAALFRLSDDTGNVEFEPISPFSSSSFVSGDAFLLEYTTEDGQHGLYVWIGKDASLKERRLSLQYAHSYLHRLKEKGEPVSMGSSIVKMNEGSESEDFLRIRDAL
ncbi:fragmin60 [Dentipellis sp. KUC8613]|nr:fragmin60 [Dentipellis sp. KUC8613]